MKTEEKMTKEKQKMKLEMSRSEIIKWLKENIPEYAIVEEAKLHGIKKEELK